MARPIYQYRPIKTGNSIPIGISLPFNKPSGKKSVDSLYTDPIEDAGSVFVSTYSTEEQAISNVVNLLSTIKGERYMQPDFGTELRTLLFEQSVDDLELQITETLTRDINKWLPYIGITKIDVTSNEHTLSINVRFKIITTGANLVIVILANENDFSIGEVQIDTTPIENILTQINTGEY